MSKNNSWQKYEIYLTFSKRLHLQSLIFISDTKRASRHRNLDGCGISSQLGEHRMRTKYNDIDKANLAYRKQRKHTHKQTRKMIMRLLALLGKILGEIRRQMRVHPDEELLNDKQLDMLDTIT